MNYHLIHDRIIHRGLYRLRSPEEKYERHHIFPKCEGGSPQGTIVYLTIKEHRLIHKIRYKLYGYIGNKLACHIMKYGRKYKTREEYSILARFSHEKFRKRDPEGYKARQQKAGRAAGHNSKINKLGFHSLTEEQRKEARDKGRNTIVSQKLGMFSDEYREVHKLTLHKRVHTPSGWFDSMTEAANHYNVVAGTVTYRVNNTSKTWSEWYYEQA